MDEIILILK